MGMADHHGDSNGEAGRERKRLCVELDPLPTERSAHPLCRESVDPADRGTGETEPHKAARASTAMGSLNLSAGVCGLHRSDQCI